MTYRFVSNGFVLAAFVLLGVAAYGYFTQQDGPEVTIEPAELVLADQSAGQVETVAFHMENPSRHAVRVVGLGIC